MDSARACVAVRWTSVLVFQEPDFYQHQHLRDHGCGMKPQRRALLTKRTRRRMTSRWAGRRHLPTPEFRLANYGLISLARRINPSSGNLPRRTFLVLFISAVNSCHFSCDNTSSQPYAWFLVLLRSSNTIILSNEVLQRTLVAELRHSSG